MLLVSGMVDQQQTVVYLPAKRGGLSKGLTQAYELRDLAHDMALQFKSFSPKTDEDATTQAREVSALIRAWAEADDHVRIHRGKPLPGTLRPERKPSKRKSRLLPAPEPVPTPTPAPAQEPVAGPEPAPGPAPTPEPS